MFYKKIVLLENIWYLSSLIWKEYLKMASNLTLCPRNFLKLFNFKVKKCSETKKFKFVAISRFSMNENMVSFMEILNSTPFLNYILSLRSYRQGNWLRHFRTFETFILYVICHLKFKKVKVYLYEHHPCLW